MAKRNKVARKLRWRSKRTGRYTKPNARGAKRTYIKVRKKYKPKLLAVKARPFKKIHKKHAPIKKVASTKLTKRRVKKSPGSRWGRSQIWEAPAAHDPYQAQGAAIRKNFDTLCALARNDTKGQKVWAWAAQFTYYQSQGERYGTIKWSKWRYMWGFPYRDKLTDIKREAGSKIQALVDGNQSAPSRGTPSPHKIWIQTLIVIARGKDVGM